MSRSTRSIRRNSRKINRWGYFPKVMEGIDVAQKAGVKIKLKAVALKGGNKDEIPTWCASRTVAAWIRNHAYGRDRGGPH